MSKLKLKPKQLLALQQIQAQKAELTKLFQDFNQKEALILELVFEENGVEGVITSVKLDADSLTYELRQTEPKQEKKKKIKEPKETV